MGTLSTRSARRTLLAAVAAGGMLAAAAATAPAAGAASKTVSQPETITINDSQDIRENSTAITINDNAVASLYPSSVTVPAGVLGEVTDVELELFSFDHTFPDDVDVMLVGPGGQRALVMSDVGASIDAGDLNVKLDDEAATVLPDSGPLTSGSFRPNNIGEDDPFPAPAPSAVGAGSALSVFDGTSPNGTWNLYIVDDSALDTGDISGGWRLRIQTTNQSAPYPSTVPVATNKGVTDVNLSLTGFSHTYPDDVDVLLVGPTGQRAVVMSDVGNGTDATGLSLTIDDEAASDLPDNTALSSGTFRPTDVDDVADVTDAFPAPAPDTSTTGSALSSFDGTDPNGTWQLFVVDDETEDVGSISGWSLEITTVDAPAAPVISSPVNNSTDDAVINFAGTAQAGSTVRILEGATERAVTTASAGGAWAVALAGVAEGQHVYTATATDSFGNTSSQSSSVTVTVDTVAPGGSIVINGGAARTNRTLLTLTLSAADPAPGSGVTQMRFSNDGTNFSAFEPYATTKSWTLPTGTNGTRTVWAQFADRAGKVSATVADSIILDTVKPRVSKIKPLKGATGVKVGVNVRAFFSEAMAKGTMTKANVKLVKAGSTKAIKATISYDAAKRKLTINPKKNLKPGTTYKVTIGTGVKDLAGNNLDQKPKKSGNQPMKWKFTTG